MTPIYLPIRSFGDFIITASVVKNNFSVKVPVILPSYLTDIYNAISGDELFDVVGTFALNNQPAFFELYKVKDLQNVKRLINDIRTISSVLHNNKPARYIMDYSSKRLFFTDSHFLWPRVNENIYDGKLRVLADQKLIATGITDTVNSIAAYPDKLHKILVLPDSRISSKSISIEIITGLLRKYGHYDIRVAQFAQSGNKETLTYSNFDELIALISSFDIIISAESLPYHLANYLGKPHFVIYNQSRHFKSTFMTPFMLNNNFYTTFTGLNIDEVLNDIGRVLTRNKNHQQNQFDVV